MSFVVRKSWILALSLALCLACKKLPDQSHSSGVASDVSCNMGPITVDLQGDWSCAPVKDKSRERGMSLATMDRDKPTFVMISELYAVSKAVAVQRVRDEMKRDRLENSFRIDKPSDVREIRVN